MEFTFQREEIIKNKGNQTPPDTLKRRSMEKNRTGKKDGENARGSRVWGGWGKGSISL